MEHVFVLKKIVAEEELGLIGVISLCEYNLKCLFIYNVNKINKLVGETRISVCKYGR